tara:strand:+ start:9223 stop:10605 length:1383 start_codon:yes stop_codon:yes gene_type:complete
MGEQAGLDWYRLGKDSMGGKLDSGGAKDPLSGLDQVTTALKNRQTVRENEVKAVEKEKKVARNAAGEKINNAFIEMGPTLKSLGQDSYNQCQKEVEVLRNEMFAAIDADDQKTIADINVRMNELKMRHSSDAENLTSFIDSYEEELVSTDAMTDEHQAIHEQFAVNPTKRIVYSEDNPPKLMYEWDIDTGELDENNEPVMLTQKYSLEDLNDMVVLKDNENGVKVMDYVEEQKQVMADGGRGPDNSAIKKQMRNIVPKDAKQLRDWTYGNPAGADGLDMFEYLMDHPMLDLSTAQYKTLGIEDINAPEGIGPEDFVDGQDKKEMIRRIMDVEDPEITRGIVCDVYAAISANNIRGREDLNPKDEKGDLLPGAVAQEDAIKQNQDKRRKFYDALKEGDFSAVQNMTEAEIIETYKLTPSEIKDGIVIDGKRYNLDSFIQGATKKPADVKSNEEYFKLIGNK